MSGLHGKLISDTELDTVVRRIVACYEAKRQDCLHTSANYRTATVPRVMVAIAGRPGGGKSTVVAKIADAVRAQLASFPDPSAGTRKPDIFDCERSDAEKQGRGKTGVEVCVMPMDGYHLYRKELHAMPNAKEAVERRGAEWTFNPEKMKRDLTAIQTPNERGLYEDVRVPSFDHGVGDPAEKDICIPGSAGVILVEGNYVLYRGTPAWAAVTDTFDVKIFLKCDRDVCIERICRRHMKAWNIPRAAAMVRAKGSDTMNGDLVDTTEKNADIVIHSIDEPRSRL